MEPAGVSELPVGPGRNPDGASSPEPLLELTGVYAGYGGGTVLHGLDIALSPGESVAVLGRNGVGKSTMLKTIMGLLRPKAGEIRFAGRRIDGRPPFRIARAGVAYVPQGRELFVDLTVEENLLLGDLDAADPERAYDLFPALAERRRETAGRLSGGQQQQLAIARALMRRPGLLLLDEPSEGVQPSVVQELAEVLAEIASTERMAVLLVEQNLDLALRVADRAVFMDRGRVVAQELVDDLRADPSRLDAHLML